MNETLDINELAKRLAQLEKQLSIQQSSEHLPQSITEKPAGAEEQDMELRIGEFWLPKLGIFVFIIGVVFSLTLPFTGIHPTLPSICGYALALTILGLSYWSRKSFPEFSGLLIGGSSAIAYLSTLRLYYFGSESFFGSWGIEVAALLFVVVTTFLYAVKNKSIYLAALGTFLFFITSFSIPIPFLMYLNIASASAVSVYLANKYEWKGLLVFAVILASLSHLVWFINNPIIEGAFELLKENHFNLFFVLVYVTIFSIGILRRKNKDTEEFMDTTTSLLNSAFGYGLFLIITLISPSVYFPFYHLTASFLFIGLATWFWIKQKSQDSTFIYSMTGYAALSVAIIQQFDLPWNLILLCWQSLLVISTAVWFKSRFIIVANFIIFLAVLAGYLINFWILNTEAISFGIVALLSARILNWQKEKLELKTENLRNAYLMTALLWIPYVFYSVLPSGYVGLSLLALSLFYFGMSKLIKNLKYRWMAVMTMLITVLYLMIFGITNSDITYKIISFLSAGIVLFITSAAYSRIKSKSTRVS